ncbi:unnamed protein product, partial [Discosporangium mesarthrocarpum]
GGGGGGVSEVGGGAEGGEPVGEEEEDREMDNGEGGIARGVLSAMAKAVKEEDPEEGTVLEGLAEKLRGREYLLDPRVFNYRQASMREACIPAANGHFTARALATLYDNFLVSLGLSSGVGRGWGEGWDEGGGGGEGDHDTPSAEGAWGGGNRVGSGGLLTRGRVNEMRSYQVQESSSLHLLFGLPSGGVRYSLGYQMFGFREESPRQGQGQGGSVRRRVRLSGFGHVGMGGSVALCDPASGMSFAMTANKVRVVEW